MSATPCERSSADPLVQRCRDVVRGDGLSTPSARADRALRRAVELRERKRQLAQGVPATRASVDLAQARARQSAERAERARRAALCRHVGAWQAHTRAAAAFEQAALSVSDAECDVMQTAAERHRLAAADHRDEVSGLLPTFGLDASSDDLLHQ